MCDYRKGKEEWDRTQLIVEGRINHPKDYGTPTADPLTVKLSLNSVILTPKVQLMTMDQKHLPQHTTQKI